MTQEVTCDKHILKCNRPKKSALVGAKTTQIQQTFGDSVKMIYLFGILLFEAHFGASSLGSQAGSVGLGSQAGSGLGSHFGSSLGSHLVLLLVPNVLLLVPGFQVFSSVRCTP